MSNIKVAVVKSTRYNDLWVSPLTQDVNELYRTTLMRCPQLALAELLKADFMIVKESFEYPCQEIVYGWEIANRQTMRYNKVGKFTDLNFIDDQYNRHVSLEEVSYDVDSIDWTKYNIVITINACIPERVTRKYPKTMWCYYVSENDSDKMSKLFSGYNLILNQDVIKSNLPDFQIGFPYTMCGPYTLENIGGKVGKKNGFYVEINNSTERPFVTVPEVFKRIFEETGQGPILHSQDILENCRKLCRAKYFIKAQGRVIRGNSVAEAISAGCLILIIRGLVTCDEIVLSECKKNNLNEIIETIQYYDSNQNEYETLVKKQRENYVEKHVKIPINNLLHIYHSNLAVNTGV